jgi:uncharacterized protein (DUF1697 family)
MEKLNMPTLISMLRGINVSGQKTIRMAELKTIYESLGYTRVTTYVQSGNVVFDCADQDVSALSGSLEKEIARRFGFSVGVIVRHSADFGRVIASNPFVTHRNEDPQKLHVTFLASLPSAVALNNLKGPVDTTDEYFLSGTEIYLFCPNGYGKTKLSNSFFEKKLSVLATTRNWKTVTALYSLANSRKNPPDNP